MKKCEPPEWITMPVNAPGTSAEPPFRIQPGWDVLIEDEKTFRDRADAALNAYVARQRELAEARRLVPALDKRQPRHFDWLALYQVKGLEYRQIAEWENVQPGSQSVGDDAIRKGVQLAATLCGLIPREGKPGRPKTRK